VSRPNLVKIGRCEVAEKSCGILVTKKIPALWESSEPPILPALRLRLDLCTCAKFGPDRLRFVGVIHESDYNNSIQ